jgi:tetratricopeptide (TPR) repeat protein
MRSDEQNDKMTRELPDVNPTIPLRSDGMIKFFLFSLLWMITGNPIIAIIVMLLVYYFIDRRYIGLLPSISKPFRRALRISNLKRQIAVNPHDMPAKYDLAQVYIERNQHQNALILLEGLSASMQKSPDVQYDTGVCHLALGHLEEGEGFILEALSEDSKLRHGEPYLRLATAYLTRDPEKSMELLQEFQTRNVSSCESYYRMGLLYKNFHDITSAMEAWNQCLDTYRVLPRFRKRVERRWALLAWMHLIRRG